MKKRPETSIRVHLLSSLVYPLCILWLISTVLAYFLAVTFANDSYDLALLNSAEAVAARLKANGSDLYVDIPPAAQAILRHNNRDKFYYQVLDRDGARISGDMVLPGPFPALDSDKPVVRFVRVNGEEARLARIPVDIPNFERHKFFVQVAETLHSRHQLAQQILLSIIVPQIILILLGALAVSRGITRGLQPLHAIKNALAQRSQFDLSPVQEDVPQEIRPLMHAINELLERLRGDIDTQKRFVANAAHQFRTPLAGLKTYIYLAKRLASGESSMVLAESEPEPTGKTDESEIASSDKRIQMVLDQIDAGCDRMSHLANKLLALAKADPERVGKFQPVDLNSIVSEITAELVGAAMQKNLNLEFISTSEPATISGDPDRLTELAENLVENALLYTPAGGRVEVKIINFNGSKPVASGLPEPKISLIVQDNGPGIPLEERERVFERFYRILGSDVPGSGLGLAIVKEIAATHNAEVKIDTGVDDTGTSVIVTFPVSRKKTASGKG